MADVVPELAGADDDVDVLCAVVEPALEAAVLAATAPARVGITVVRRCVDLPDLLAAAAARTAAVVLVGAGLRRLDREVLARLAGHGLAVVGLVEDPTGERDEARLRQLGIAHVVAVDPAGDPASLAQELSSAVAAALRAPAPEVSEDPVGGWAGTPPLDPSKRRDLADPDLADPGLVAPDTPGRVVAVWGPTGAPGRSFVAWHLAGELSAEGREVLLVDADVYGGCQAQQAGLTDEAPGLVAACRAANLGALDVERLAAAARRLPMRGPGSLSVLTGIARAARWPEVRPSTIGPVLRTARRLADVTVVDCAFALEQDEELAYDGVAARRNGATVEVLAEADEIVVVGAADPVGLTRLVLGLDELRDTLADVGLDPSVRVVVNRFRGSGRGRREIGAALARHAGLEPEVILPLDLDGAERCLDVGRPLVEAAPRSPVRRPLALLGGLLVG